MSLDYDVEIKEFLRAYPKFNADRLAKVAGLSRATIYRVRNKEPITLRTLLKVRKAMDKIRDNDGKG